ncbi:MAG: hypothetical protein SNJ77_07685 [Cytophagales bacterium]
MNSQETEIKVEVKKTNVKNETSNDGSLEIIKIKGGTPPYEIHWFGYKVNNVMSNQIKDLNPGRYVLLVQDKNKKSTKLEFNIECCR